MHNKELMIGNAAVARGLWEAGCGVVSSYPGTPSTEITETAAKYDEIYCEWAPNEKTAVETAFGACMAGRRSACAMKHVGLNVAADPMFTISYTGVNAGMVICVADDPGMFSSQNEQDSRNYARASKIPMLEPSDSEEARVFAKTAYEISEKFDTPVLLRMTTRIAHSQSIVNKEDRVEVSKEYKKNPKKHIMVPANAIARHPVVEERLEKIAEYSETAPFNTEELTSAEIGVITSGASYQYVKEILGNTVSILKLGMVYPFPDNLLKEFASKVSKLYVVEELDGFIEGHCREIGLDVVGKELFPKCGELTQKDIVKAFGIVERPHAELYSKLPVRPPMMCSGCPHRGIYYILAKHKLTVMGDIGCYTLGAQPPLSSIDVVTCMGASVTMTHGYNKATDGRYAGKTVGVIGDSTFMHSGITGLANVAYNGSDSVIIILDNSITGMTGHQQNPTTGYNIKGDPATKIDLEALCHALGIERVRVVDPYNLGESEKVIMEELEAKGPSVIISRRPCVLLKYVKTNPPMKADADKCRGCKKCMKLGCPSISIRDGKAHIDQTLCTGCAVCSQLCAFGAIG
ncbi:MAG: indolepyruvate ferredoxin oxidoreductase subunit alpha [Clostridia bacterium]|nr:indolepyruvate ferredoxin oxidoreductase subunit alpha [Clostridia bacterium]